MFVRNPIDAFRRAARNSPWLVMSVLFHAILLVGLGLLVIRGKRERVAADPTLVVLTRTAEAAPVETFEPPPVINRSKIPEAESAEIVDPTNLVFPTDLPVPAEEDLTQDIGDPSSTDFLDRPAPVSGAIGVGPGGSPRGLAPSPFNRPGLPGGTGTNLPPGQPRGPTTEIDKAVRHGLLWLCRHQNPDGSWGLRSMKDRCDPKAPCFDPKLATSDHYDEGLTSLAVLAFLGAGLTHSSKLDLVDPVQGKRHRVGEVVRKGLKWLVQRQNPDGSFSRDRAFLYNEALATMALSEAYGLTRATYWKDPAARGVACIQEAQRPSPAGKGRWGWRYASRKDVEDPARATGDAAYAMALHDSDTSVTAWCVMALKSAQLSGFEVDPAAMQGAMDYCRFATAAEGAVGYVDARTAGATVAGPFAESFTYHPATMSALGMCIRIFAEHDAGDPFLDLAARKIVADLPSVSRDGASVDYYYWYYASLALNQLDGPDNPKRSGRYWNTWNKAMVEALLALQEKTEGSCAEGGWIASDRWGSASGAGPLYATAMNVLTLEVYYRYPNAFGRKRS